VDIPAYTAMAAHPDMSAYTGSPADEGAVWRMFAFQVGHWALQGFGMWLAHDRTTGEFVGRVGLYEEYGWPGTEVAWTIRRERWGEGLATEGGAAALEYAFEVLARERLISIIHPENAASIRVAEKLGLALAEGPVDRGGRPRNIYAITRHDWAARRQASAPADTG
jgi:RimJ/RimL family protein N-acetyltransferase